MTTENRGAESQATNSGLTGVASRVRCEGFICLAYLDDQCRWHNYYTRELLPEVLEVLSPEAQERGDSIRAGHRPTVLALSLNYANRASMP